MDIKILCKSTNMDTRYLAGCVYTYLKTLSSSPSYIIQGGKMRKLDEKKAKTVKKGRERKDVLILVQIRNGLV